MTIFKYSVWLRENMLKRGALIIFLFAIIFIIGCQDIKGVNVASDLKADFNKDGCVNEEDWLRFQKLYNLRLPGHVILDIDLNDDRKIDFTDFVAFANIYDGDCVPEDPFATTSTLPEPLPDLTQSCNTIYESDYPESDSINIVFIGDSYSANDLSIYSKDVKESVDFFLEDPVIKPYKERMNVFQANYVGDLECKFETGCVPLYGKILTLGILSVVPSKGTFCCNSDKVESEINYLCGERPYVMNVISNEEEKAGTVLWYFSPPLYKIVEFLDPFGILGRLDTGITAQTRVDKTTFSHEIGHLVAGLPDYPRDRFNDLDPCGNYKCKMCTGKYPYSDKGMCYDKQGITRWLNQWCEADVEILTSPRTSPYPNPFNPSNNQSTTIEFSLVYEPNQDPCYALLSVYNINGQLVDMAVSEEPLSDGDYKIFWDCRNIFNQKFFST